jgi:hypothetical protein
MQADTGMKLVLVAGVMTFGNEWYQTHEVNWRVPVATVLAAAAVGAIGKASPNGGAGLGVMALIVAATTRLNGRSPVQELASVVNKSSPRRQNSRTVGKVS